MGTLFRWFGLLVLCIVKPRTILEVLECPGIAAPVAVIVVGGIIVGLL